MSKTKELIKKSLNETALLNRYLKSRGINPQFVNKDQKVAHSKTNQFKVWMRAHVNDSVQEAFTTEKTPVQKRLQVLKKSVQTHKEIRVPNGEKKLHTEAVDKRDVVAFDIPLLIRMLEYAREDAKTDMDLHKVVEKLIRIRNKGVLTMKDYKFVVSIREGFEEAGIQLNELSPETLGRYKEKAMKSADELASKGKYKKSTNRLMGHMKATGKQIEKMYKKESMEPLAATQQPFDGANNTDDTIPAKRKNMKEMSKSARIIKSIYKNKGVKSVKEEMYDHEKEDKSTAPLGKKVKLQKPGIDTTTKQAPEAAAVLTGGKTMTGEPRDTIEIDPMMKSKKVSPNSQKSL